LASLEVWTEVFDHHVSTLLGSACPAAAAGAAARGMVVLVLRSVLMGGLFVR